MYRKLLALLTVGILLVVFETEINLSKTIRTVHPETEVNSGIIPHTFSSSIIFESGVTDFSGSESQSLPVMVRIAGNIKSTFNFQIFSIALRHPALIRKRPIYLMVKCLRH